MANEIQRVALSRLLLDPDNPRLPARVGRSQKEMLDYIARNTAIEDIMSAVGANDFFEGEALIVYRNPKDKAGLLRVVEGNRRLTAVKLLSDPTLCAARKTIAEIAGAAKYKPTMLPVIERTTREEVLPYLGSRHIVGVRQWEPLAKARYMYQLFSTLTKKTDLPATRYRDVARRIGSYSRTDLIKKNLDALAVYEVIEANNFFEIPELNESNFEFGTFYSVLPYASIGDFVGTGKLKADGTFIPADPIVKPQSLNVPHIKELTEWCFARDEDGNTVLGESRGIPKLAAVISAPRALAALRKGSRLEFAYMLSAGVDEEFTDFLVKAKNYLHQASAIVSNASAGAEQKEVADSVFELARGIRNALKTKDSED